VTVDGSLGLYVGALCLSGPAGIARAHFGDLNGLDKFNYLSLSLSNLNYLDNLSFRSNLDLERPTGLRARTPGAMRRTN